MSILEQARAVIEHGPVCDSCLGRCFADRSFGLTNAERGRSLRITVAMADDEPYEPSDDCWVCETATSQFDVWADRARQALEGIQYETYQVGTRTPPLIEENERLLREDAGIPEDAGESFKSEFNREVGKRLGSLTGTEVDFDRPDVVALLNLERGMDADPDATGVVDVQVNPAFVYGRYQKLERDIPQTDWPCRECGGSGKQMAADGSEEACEHCGGAGYLYEDSVESLTAPPVLEAMDGSEALFHGAGREDVDALMLGTGRPFVVEVKHPRRRTPDIEALEAEINEFAGGRAAVSDLALATHEMVERVKELDASKTYRMDVEFAEPVTEDAFQDALDELEGVTVEQYTPQRVDHRRAGKTRTRTVYEITGELVDDTHADIELHGEGGLYVKELVSGDEGRTEPSLAGVLDVDAEVTALDVLAVEGEDEPFGAPEYVSDATTR